MALGVLFSFLASVCFNLNNLMEKRAVDQMPEISARRAMHMVRMLSASRLWLSGFVVGIFAVGFMVLAYSLAPIAVIQSIFGAGLVLLVLASRLYLHEPMGRREYLGLAVIVLAVTLVSVTLTSATSPGAGGSTARALITSAATATVSGLAFWALRRSTADAGIRFGVTSGLLYAVASLQMKSSAVLLERHGVLDGALRVIGSPYPYIFVVMSILGLLTFQTGLQRCRVAVVAPITNIVASIYIVVVGMAVFDESFPHDVLLMVLRILGFALVLAGSWVFTTGPAIPSQLGPTSVD
ncbi:MAG: hypothetical protein ABSA31_01735 [Acidimicrobiales bacterium]|jgi:multidrug transporter EmrE-like cation transporter